MRLEQSFTVAAAIDEVWRALIDVQRVAPCLPGAQITEIGDDGTYHGTFTVKLGPTTAAYNGTLKLEDVDEGSRTATMSARGTDRRGQGAATATIHSTMREDGGATNVDVVTDFTITGRLARFGRGGMIEDVSKRLLRDFAACLQESIGGAQAQAPPAAPPPDGAARPTSGPGRSTPEPGPASAAPAPRAAEPLDGLRLVLSVAGDRLRRLWAALGRRLGRSR